MSKRADYEFKEPQDAAPLFWKSLEAKANPEEHAARAKAEFPRESYGKDLSGEGDESFLGNVGRRGFLFGGLSAAMLAVEGCARRPTENILPFTKAPEYQLPGMASHYATVRAHRGEALGLVVESHEGRPTKIEGNPDHPASLGAADLLTQAFILDLYDPDRSTAPMKGKDASNWQEVDAFFAAKVKGYAADGGAKLRILAQPSNSPTFVRLRDQVQAKFPHARIHTWAPVSESNAREGARIAFGQAVTTINDYALARVILSLDADFLQTESGNVRATKLFSKGRRLTSANDAMSRLYVVETAYTTTGANADHRLRLPARDIESYLLALAKELASRPGIDLGPAAAAFSGAGAVEGVPEKWIKVVAGELVKNRGRGIVVAGSRQPARVHALVHAINYALGNSGSTVNHYPVVDPSETDAVTDLKTLAADIDKGQVETLLILGGNPVYDAPVDLKFADKLGKVTSVHLSDRVDETSEKATWHLPLAHALETWGDQRALDGTLSVQQPLIAPLHGGRSEIEILALLLGEKPNGYELVRGSMKAGAASPLAFETQWKAALNKGLFAGASPRPFGALPVRAAETAAAFPKVPPARPLGADNLEIAFAADVKLFDGRYANNPWLLEIPDLMTKVTWDNAAMISPATAKALGIASGDVIQIARDGVSPVEIVAWIMAGHADNSITVTLGWGRTAAGRYGSKKGFDVYPLRHSDALGFADGAKVTKLGKTYELSQTQEHHSMEGRPIAIDATLDQYRATPDFAQYKSPDPKVLPLWKPVDYSNGHKWGMTIDLAACTGCNACVIACQSENNIATVGKEQVSRNREMHWIRIDRYFVGKDESNPPVSLQPLMCVQCEEAPCENVCPVNATAHSPEGLNDLAYNRCIGTRYCANNCPYKVRRFNYLEFQGGPPGSSIDTLYGDLPETRKMQFNPDVTVRMRGVMEKCTYCVQRIQEGKIASHREDNRPIRDGEIVSACAQTCPADAIVFGDLNDPNSRVARLAKTDRRYKLLSEIGTRPRTTYLAKIRNPNAEMEKA
jgi:molybdopterin-containing oxidoreductase family iron-sulfur binding subunit